ncbi:MAG: hypothetical protein OEV42_15435 [Deltaproteobacteria bacterium]|nr:hypothetical protein [Deltaproteobacteria bacterium]
MIEEKKRSLIYLASCISMIITTYLALSHTRRLLWRVKSDGQKVYTDGFHTSPHGDEQIFLSIGFFFFAPLIVKIFRLNKALTKADYFIFIVTWCIQFFYLLSLADFHSLYLTIIYDSNFILFSWLAVYIVSGLFILEFLISRKQNREILNKRNTSG